MSQLEKAMKLTTFLQNVSPRLGATISKKMLSEATESIFGKSVLFCISGGSALRPSAQYMLNALGYPLYNGYGMSEIGITSVELRNTPKKEMKAPSVIPSKALNTVLTTRAYSTSEEAPFAKECL